MSYSGTFQAFSLGATRCHLLVPLVRSRCESSVEKKDLVTPWNRAPFESPPKKIDVNISIYMEKSQKCIQIYKYIWKSF